MVANKCDNIVKAVGVGRGRVLGVHCQQGGTDGLENTLSVRFATSRPDKIRWQNVLEIYDVLQSQSLCFIFCAIFGARNCGFRVHCTVCKKCIAEIIFKKINGC